MALKSAGKKWRGHRDDADLANKVRRTDDFVSGGLVDP
jgi:hypothetical protein